MTDLIISGIIDGPLSGGVPKAVEFYALDDIADLSVYGFGSANNGGAGGTEEYTFSGSVNAGEYIYIASETEGFSNFFGFTPDDTSSAASINGDDAIELFFNDSVIDVFGVVGVDGTGEPWEYLDGWAYREPETNPSTSFNLADWTFSGTDALDDETSNSTANTPFPLGTYDNTHGGGEPEIVTIPEIQGTGQISPLLGEQVTTTGIVTAVDTNGFYLQDATGDGNIATSDALFVFTGSAPGVNVGDALEVDGTVSEFTPGGASTRNLSTTQISGNPEITVLSPDNPLPTAVVIGEGGRVPPSENIDDDAFSSFDPTTDGIDFFESLEGMRVTAQDLVAVSGTNRFGEIFTVVDNGANATGISDRNTLNISPDDFNPEKIQIDADSGVLPGFELPLVDTGAKLGDVTGVVSYGFGNFEIIPTAEFSVVEPSSLTAETTTIESTAEQVTVASYNVLNLDPNDSDGDTDLADGRFDAIAQQIVNNLNTPDIIGLQEIQDNNGSVDDGTIAADQTLQTLVEAIDRVDDGLVNSSLVYEFIDNPFITDGLSGGQPGGNIRTAFLYQPDRVSLIEDSGQTIGSQAPGAAFNGARLPLVASFEFNNQEVTVVNNHFSSKGGSAPILGTEQPFEERQEDATVNGSLDERQAQSEAVQKFVNSTLTEDLDANLVVIGDFNEFEFVSPVSELAQDTPLVNLTNTLPEDERYSFIFQGNSQSLDHILVNDNLAASAEFEVVHLNAEFAETDSRASDHEPLVAGLTIENTLPDNTFYFSSDRDKSVGELAIKDEDIVLFDGTEFSIFFDGSEVLPRYIQIDAFDVISDTEILLSFNFPVSLAGLGWIDDSDVVQFTANSLGEGNTDGSFELYLDGSDLGLTNFFEDIDAINVMADDSLLFSTQGNARLSNGLKIRDEDLVRFDPLSGDITLYFDGSDVELTRFGEDIDAVGMRDAQLLFSTRGNFAVLGVSGRNEAVFSFDPISLGELTSGSFSSDLFFDGSQFGLTGNLSGIDFGNS